MKESLDSRAVKRIADSFVLADPTFDSAKFSEIACKELDLKELKQRVEHIIDALLIVLPEGFEECANLIESLVPVWIKGKEEDAFQAFAAWPVIDFIAAKGEAYPHVALPLLRVVTSLFSAEFAIRSFIKANPQICYEYFETWLLDESEDVRRLVSEGTRPRLPWAPKLSCAIVDPTRNIKLISQLRNDSSMYVRRSVANHLNDISKDHPDIVLDLCEAWYPGANENLKWLIRHATRTLVKQGGARVYPLLGYTADPKLASVVLNLETKRVDIGEDLIFEVLLESASRESQSFVVDFSLNLLKSNGKRQPKVFKLKNISLSSGASRKIRKSMAIKEISTRRYYAGTQEISILINGVAVANEVFELLI